MAGADDDPREPGDIEQPFLLVEIPGPVLLRHQPPLEPVCELGDRALEMGQLLIEIGAQPPQLLLVAQIGRADDLVILAGEDPVIELRRQIGKRPVRSDGNHALVAFLADPLRALGQLLLRPVALGVLAFGLLLLAAYLGLAAPGPFLALVLVALVAFLLLVVLALAFDALFGLGRGVGLARLAFRRSRLARSGTAAQAADMNSPTATPVRWPRLLALLIALPALAFLAMLAGIVGGAAVCALSMDISPTMFVTRFHDLAATRHFWVGMSKAPIFAFLIASIGCLEGFKVSGSAESVGTHTTSSVVQSIFVAILVDALAAIFYMEIDV